MFKSKLISWLSRGVNCRSTRRLSSVNSSKINAKNESFNQCNTKQSSKQSSKHLYRNLFDWHNQIDLAKLLVNNIVYNDYGLIAISKPYGLGIYKSNAEIDWKNQSKVEQFLNSQIIGQPKYSINECIDLIRQLMNLERPLRIVKSCDRKWSGLVLLSEHKGIENLILKSLRRAKAELLPPLRFYCIVNGIMPNVSIGQWYQERCGIRLTEIDEFGEAKEPIYVAPDEMTKNLRKTGAHRNNKYQLGPVKSATIKYRVLAQNPELSVSLVDLHTTTTKWSAIQCFLAYKTSFVLGDTFFSYRVKHIFGQKITMSTLKQQKVGNWRPIDQSFEPLSKPVRECLNVRSNREIPLMIHHHGLLLPRLKRSLRSYKNIQQKPQQTQQQTNELIKINGDDNNEDDIIIETNVEHLPKHFQQTLNCLNLNIFSKNS